MKKFISSFVLVVIIIALVISNLYCLKKIVTKNNDIYALQNQNDDLSKKISDLNNAIENLQDKEIEEDNKNKQKDEEKNKETENPKLYFNEENVVNIAEATRILPNISDNMRVLNVSVNTETNSLVINLDAELAKLIYGYVADEESHTITGFSHKIVDCQIAICGEDYKDLKIIILMENGAIKYLDINSVLDKTYTVKTVSDSSDYIKVVKVMIRDEQKEKIKYGIVGIKSNGKSYIIEF